MELLWMATVKIGEDDKGVTKRDALRGLITRRRIVTEIGS